MFWRRRKREAGPVLHKLRNGKTAWLYPGEILIDKTKARKGMERKFDIYINGAFIGRTNEDTMNSIVLALKPLVLNTEFLYAPHRNAGFLYTPAMRSARFQVASRAPEAIRTAVRIMDGEQKPGITEAARAFEQAINSDPDLRVEAHRIETCPLGDEVSRCVTRIFVTRETSEQVYP